MYTSEEDHIGRNGVHIKNLEILPQDIYSISSDNSLPVQWCVANKRNPQS